MSWLKSWLKSLTIIEVMIITAIIGILAAMIVPIIAPGEPKTYVLHNGTEVICGRAMNSECGVTLINCKDGRTYKCMTNVSEKNVVSKTTGLGNK